MTIKDVFEYDEELLAAILQARPNQNKKDTEQVFDKIKKALDGDNDVEMTIPELWRINRRIAPELLKGTAYASFDEIIISRLEEALDYYTVTESFPPTLELRATLKEFNDILYSKRDENAGEPSLSFLVKNITTSGLYAGTDIQQCFINIAKSLFLKMYSEAVELRALYAHMNHDFYNQEEISLFCQVDENPIYKHPLYVVLDFLIDIRSEPTAH